MAVPKRKTSKSRRDKRSANSHAEVKPVVYCKTCKSPVLPHRVCFDCGYYKGEKVIRTKADRMHDRGQARKEKEAQVVSSNDVKEPAEQDNTKE